MESGTALPKDVKQPYETPNLTRFGKVEEITQGVLTPGTDNAVIGSQPA